MESKGQEEEDEEAAQKTYDELMESKGQEVEALTESIDEKMKMVGELAVTIIEMKEDLSDTEAALVKDKDFLKNLEASCATKTKEWEERSKTRAEELTALSETIKILNDDDALDLFKKNITQWECELCSSTAEQGNASAESTDCCPWCMEIRQQSPSPRT